MPLVPAKGLPLAELPDSPKYQFTAEKSSQVRVFQGAYAEVLANIVRPGATLDGLTCTNCNIERMPGGRGQMTVTCEVGGTLPGGQTLPLPADEWGFASGDISPALSRHPKFGTLTEDQLQIVENALKSIDPVTRAAWAAATTGAGSTPLTNYRRLRAKGVETYYLVSLTYTWTARYYSLPALSSGGTLETPGGPGWSAVSGLNWKWLRQIDVPSYSGGIYTVVRSWVGAPGGHWDTYLYT